MGILIASIGIVRTLLWLAGLVIVIQAVLSWLVAFNVVNQRNDFVRAVWTTLDRVTQPIYRPIRRILPDFGGIDFSPLVILLLIWIVRDLLFGLQVDLQRSLLMIAWSPA